MIDRNTKMAFAAQKHRAKVRGIEFLMSRDEWLHVWSMSGKFSQRGRGKGKYCMCRKNDTGPYSVDNVYIDLFENNNVDQHRINTRYDKSGNSLQILSPTGELLEFPSCSSAARYFNVSVNMIWNTLVQNKTYKGYCKI